MDSTLLKGLTLLEALVTEDEPLGVSELARRMGLPKSNVHRSLSTLHEAGYVSFDTESRRYYPSLRLAQIGHRVAARFPFRMAVLPVLQDLVARTGESAHFTLLDGASVVFVANALPSVAIASVVPDSLALAWEDSAFGLALVSALPEADRARLTAAADDPASGARLDEAARDGHALIRRHETRRIFELAMPVRSDWGTVIGAIGLTGPALRFGEDRLADQIAAVERAAHAAFAPAGPGLSQSPRRG